MEAQCLENKIPLNLLLVGRVRVELTGPNGQQIYSLPPPPTGLPAQILSKSAKMLLISKPDFLNRTY